MFDEKANFEYGNDIAQRILENWKTFSILYMNYLAISSAAGARL